MQIVCFSSSSSSSSGSHCEQKGMDKFEPHPLSPPPPPHFKGKQHHRHRPHPPHRHHHNRHHHQHDVELRHGSPSPPPCSHHERGKLRVKPPKHSKKVRKLHHFLMKGFKRPKGARHGHKHHHHQHHMQFPPPEGGFPGSRVDDHHPPGCCLHVDTCIGDYKLGEEQRPHGMGPSHHHHHHPHRYLRSHPPHARKWGGPCIRSEVVGVAEAIMWPIVSPVAAPAPADMPTSGVPPPAYTILPADEATRAP